MINGSTHDDNGDTARKTEKKQKTVAGSRARADDRYTVLGGRRRAKNGHHTRGERSGAHRRRKPLRFSLTGSNLSPSGTAPGDTSSTAAFGLSADTEHEGRTDVGGGVKWESVEDTIAELRLLENLKPFKNTSGIAFLFALGFKY